MRVATAWIPTRALSLQSQRAISWNSVRVHRSTPWRHCVFERPWEEGRAPSPPACPATQRRRTQASLSREFDAGLGHALRGCRKANILATCFPLIAVFRDAKVLNVSEVNLVLGSYLEFARAREPDYQPNPLLEKSLEYAKRFCTSRNKDALQKMRE